MSKHVETPWYAEPDPKSGKWSINNGFETFIDVRSGLGGLPAEDTAKFIVKACNSHDAMVDVCRAIVAYDGFVGDRIGSIIKKAEAALKLAEGEER